MQQVSPPLPATEEMQDRRVVLRDGSVATVRTATPEDRDAVRRFFHELSPESKRKRFFVNADPSETLIERLCDSSDPARGQTLVVERLVRDRLTVIAVGSYVAVRPATAETAFAVDDHFQGKGLGTALLERLAVAAAANGFSRFEATTLADNNAMLEVFRDSGFQIRSKSSGGCVDLQLSLTPSLDSVASAEECERVATIASLRPLLEPRSVAVIGASRDGASLGRVILDALLAAGFAGPVYAVNPRATAIDHVKVYASARDLPHDVDLAILAVPRGAVLGAVDECAAAGIKSLVVITAGFAETDDAGRLLQRQLVEKVRHYGMRMVGPNCMGLVNTDPAIRLNASFSLIFPPQGGAAFSSQSGALGMTILALAAQRGLGLSSFVSVGNKADVSGNDLLQYWESDSRTSVILLYLESFGNPRRFARLARRITRKKPIVAVKAGRTGAGSRAAGSHTAALAARDVAVDALFHQSGVIRADTIDEMFDIAACLDMQPLPAGRRVAIVTNAGGPGILTADACEAAGLTVTEFSASTRAQLANFLPPTASLANPVDIIASAGREEYRRAVEVALTAEEIDALIVIYTPIDTSGANEILDAIRAGIAAGRRAGATDKPVLTCVMAEPGRPLPLRVDEERVPAYTFPENAARALGKVAAYAQWRRQPAALFWSFDDIRADEASGVCRGAVEVRGDTWLTGEEVRRVLYAFGLPVAAGTLAHTADEAAALARVIGFPVVAKLAARTVQHKTDAGLVRLNLATDEDVRHAFDAIMSGAHKLAADTDIEGVCIQSMITGGIELMVGVTQDPSFGPLVAFGLGGIHVEILGDVQFRVAPLTDRDVDEMIHGIRGVPLLGGYRGHAPADLDAVRDLLLRVSRLAVEVPEIAELDLNPVIALPPGHGCRIVDVRVRARRASSASL
jgi:acetyl coenzyme A synthetase (ADP forming)-like protein